MEVLHEQSAAQDDDTPEPTIISRRQAELEAANARLQHTAQNFSSEWKSFLGYVMEIKQQRKTTGGPPTGEQDLEDLLLKTQDGLVLLRDLHNRRDRQWKEVAELYGYHRQCDVEEVPVDHPTQQLSKQPQWLQILISKLSMLSQQVAATAHCAVKRSQLTANQDHTPTALPPSLVTLRAHALETYHRLQHSETSDIDDVVQVEDVNLLLQFDYMKHQQAVVLERFCLRLKWLPVSHRYHLRQRMLALIHHQKLKNTSRPNASTTYQSSKHHLHCPVFVTSPPQFAEDLKTLAQKCSLSMSDKSGADEFHALKQDADAVLASIVGCFPQDNAINRDGSLEMALETLAHTYTQNSRWDLIQRGYLGNCEPGLENIQETLIALRNHHKIDTLLVNEWELLSLDDIEYLRGRLEALFRSHMNRAEVDVEKSGFVIASDVHPKQITEEAYDEDSGSEDDEAFSEQKSGLPGSWNLDALYSFYALRVSSCRAKRRSLLRLLNYLHFIQFCQTNSLPAQGPSSIDSPRQKSTNRVSRKSTITPWIVKKCEKTGDYIIKRSPSREKGNIYDEESDSKDGDGEFIFAAARRDLEVLELQMLRMASIFIFKQEYDSLPTSSRNRSNNRYGSSHDSDSIVTTIDRLQVLQDIYNCEVTFQQTKLQLVERILGSGLRSASTKQTLSELGIEAHTDARSFADVLLPLLQKRPYLDFSHAYFFESYTTETALLVLQISLVHEMEQHLNRLEWCPLQDFAFVNDDDSGNEQRQWVCRQILGRKALIKLYSQQNELVREADEKWFTPTSIGEFHALQHALLEQMLTTWSLIIKCELPGRPMHCLERTAGDLFVGSGWQLVFSPQLSADVCRSLHEQNASASNTLVAYLAKSVELGNWRQKLAKSVYEAHLLERIHNFQFDFVKQVDTLDAVHEKEQARNVAYFFDFGECDRNRKLQPIAVELETQEPSSSRPTTRSGDSKAVSEWLRMQLSGKNDDFNERGEGVKQANNSENWRQSLLQLQLNYVSHLRVDVSYQDAIGADVFEFAASYPYTCLASTLVSESTHSSDEKATIEMDLNTVRTKYAKEIANKMAEEMRTSCYPYWKNLENFKRQLQERFAANSNESSDGFKSTFASVQTEYQLTVDMVACALFLEEESYHPRLLTTLNSHLQRLRNEKKLMKHLSQASRAKCAFTSQQAASGKDPNGGEDQPYALTKWLMGKLHQLKVDLHIHERPKVEKFLLTPPASHTSPSAVRGKRTRGTDRYPLESSSSDAQTLLQTIPSIRSLLLTYAATSINDKPPNDSSGRAADARATRLHACREETLRTVVLIFQHFNSSLDLLRIRCGFRFSSSRQNLLGSGEHRVKSTGTPPGRAHSGLSRLERWQTLFHHEIRQLLEHITSSLSPEAALVTDGLFDTHPEHLQIQHCASLMRQEICSALHEANVYSLRMIRCTSTFSLLQTYQKNAGIRVRKSRQHLINFQSILENITAEVNASSGPKFAARMSRVVQAAEIALFGEARPEEGEREWHIFKDAVRKYGPKDDAYIAAVTRLLELHRVYIDENCRTFLRLQDDTTSPYLAPQYAAENHALTALVDLWERFQLPAWDSVLVDEGFASSGRSTAPIVGGENLNMKIRLLGSPDLGNGVSSSGSQSYSSPKEQSFALRSLLMGATTTLAQFCKTGLLVLPPQSSIEEQLAYFHISVELMWVNADMKELEDQYKQFLFHRKKHREHQRALSPFSRKLPSAVPGSSCSTPTSLLLALSKYYREERIPQSPDLASNIDVVPVERKVNKQATTASFVIPAPEMAHFLHDLTAQCVEHNKQQLDLHTASIQHLHDQFHATSLERQKIEKLWANAKAEETIRREAFAVDHGFHLYFELEALRKQVNVLEAQKELDQQVMRCDINAEYDEKLKAMHAELIDRQQKFAEYRTTVQREMQSVIQGAHSQFVDQLTVYTGTLPSTTKASVSTLLRGQQDIVRIKSENATMKQALLKVQALGDMQQQTQNSTRERELLLSQRYSTAEALQRNEVEKLQAYVKQLEGNLSKMSQEKTYFRVKWTAAQKQMEAAAQKKREAKVRVLSASYSRASMTPDPTDSDDDELPVITPKKRIVPDAASDIESIKNVSPVRPRTAVSSNHDTSKQEKQRLEAQYLNSTRHYQNEIRRLQQQVTREILEKATIAEQLTNLRQETTVSIQPRDGFVEDPQALRTSSFGEKTLGRNFVLPTTPRRTQSASPRATPGGLVASPPNRTTTLRRPSTSISPRASLLRAQVTAGSGSQPPALVPYSNTPVSPPSSSTSGTSARKFQVVKRDTNVVGGVAGVSNIFSVREPLPYR